MTNILQDHPDVKGVFAVNDIIALSVFEVTKEHGYKNTDRRSGWSYRNGGFNRRWNFN
ncbi:hypothetical protein GCM10020331_079590 [Ectobacillus funiculus]